VTSARRWIAIGMPAEKYSLKSLVGQLDKSAAFQSQEADLWEWSAHILSHISWRNSHAAIAHSCLRTPSSPYAAQPSAKSDFSGTWNFVPAKSKMQIPVPTSAIFRVDHREPVFKISRTLVQGGKRDDWKIDLTTDCGTRMDWPTMSGLLRDWW